MNPILAALFAGFLNTQHLDRVALVCDAEAVAANRVAMTCVLFDAATGTPLRAVKTNPVPVPEAGLPSQDLATTWCELGQRAMTMPGQAG